MTNDERDRLEWLSKEPDATDKRGPIAAALAVKIHGVLMEAPAELADKFGTLYAGDVVEALLRAAAATMVAFNPDLNDDIFPAWGARFQKLHIAYRASARHQRAQQEKKPHGTH